MEGKNHWLFTKCQILEDLKIKMEVLLLILCQNVVTLHHETNKVLARIKRVSIN